MKILNCILVALGTLISLGCSSSGIPGSGVAKTETRQLEPFDAVEFHGAGSIEITIGTPQSFEITCDDNLLALIETTVTDGKLVVKPMKEMRDFDLEIRVTVADLSSLAVDGAGGVDIKGIDNERLDITIDGAAGVIVTGKTERFDIAVDGAGGVEADGLEARSAKVQLSGAGGAEVHAIETLDVSITGIGSVVYSGNPKVTKSVAGLGTVKKKS